MTAELIVPKIVRWGRKVGQVSTGRPNIPKGELFWMAYQKGTGSSNSAPVGRRRTRFYQGRFQCRPSTRPSVPRPPKGG
jgi:hypothetical protein